jgi:hypothetical protein
MVVTDDNSESDSREHGGRKGRGRREFRTARGCPVRGGASGIVTNVSVERASLARISRHRQRTFDKSRRVAHDLRTSSRQQAIVGRRARRRVCSRVCRDCQWAGRMPTQSGGHGTALASAQGQVGGMAAGLLFSRGSVGSMNCGDRGTEGMLVVGPRPVAEGWRRALPTLIHSPTATTISKGNGLATFALPHPSICPQLRSLAGARKLAGRA